MTLPDLMCVIQDSSTSSIDSLVCQVCIGHARTSPPRELPPVVEAPRDDRRHPDDRGKKTCATAPIRPGFGMLVTRGADGWVVEIAMQWIT